MISRKGSPSAPFTAKAITAMASMTRMASAALRNEGQRYAKRLQRIA